jgi:hypothetical protein
MPNLARNLDASSPGDRPHVTDTPIDYSVPYRSRIKGASRHFGFSPFFAKKPWPVIQEYIKHYTSPGELVCDPFSGSGVTPVEALVLGRRTVASDINPFARFITRMTAVAPVDVAALRASFDEVRAAALAPIEALDHMSDAEVAGLLLRLDYPRDPIPQSVRGAGGAETINELHTPRQLAGLSILRGAIEQTKDHLLRELLMMALANTVRYCNRTYILPFDKGKRRSPYRGDAGVFRRFSYSPASEALFYELLVWPTFDRMFKNVLEAKQETNKLIGERYSERNITFADVPARRIHEVTGEGTVDYCFTDPPYSNRIHFVDLSALWAAWLRLDITTETRRDELLIGGSESKTRQQFEQEFAASMEAIARALKPDRWFTLVYKHRDLSLWQSIVAACERSGLRYVNAVWQDLKITSTRQRENPNINPSGDMYLNFRKMSQRKFDRLYPRAVVLDMPTQPNYVEKEIERLIVSYLGADIKIIVSGVIQQILDSRAFRNYRENPAELTEDIQKLLETPRFAIWQLDKDASSWVMNPGSTLDPSLPTIDRARYYVFEFLREQGEAKEGDVHRHLLTRFSEAPDVQMGAVDVSALLRHVGTVVAPRRWRFEPKKVTLYKQLRLFFQRSRADEIRDKVEDKEAAKSGLLLPDYEGITLLLDRLRQVNAANDEFERQSGGLLEVLKTALQSLTDFFEDKIEKVLAVGEWARHGLDLRNLPFEEVVIQIVLRSEERSFALYREIAEKVFSQLADEEILLQFTLLTPSEWRRAVASAKKSQREEDLGVLLLDRI